MELLGESGSGSESEWRKERERSIVEDIKQLLLPKASAALIFVQGESAASLMNAPFHTYRRGSCKAYMVFRMLLGINNGLLSYALELE